MNCLLIAAHLAAFIFFALNYLRLNVGLKKSQSVYKSQAEEAKLNLKSIAPDLQLPDKPAFDRFAFVLLDAWRWDFLFSSSTPMPFLKR